jgi:hypothetical protein
VTPGFDCTDRRIRPSVTSAGDARGVDSPIDRQIALRIAPEQ